MKKIFGGIEFLIIATVFLILFCPTSVSIKTERNSLDFSEEQTQIKPVVLTFDPNITIPDDFSTIQEGINNAESGDVIFIKSGIYKENLIINMSNLVLQGQHKYNSILDGDKTSGDGIIILSENVTIKNFTIRNYKDSSKDEIYSWDQAGIELHKANSVIQNNRFIDNGVGIELCSNAFNTTIKNNEMINDGLLIGNYFYSTDGFPKITSKSFKHKIENNTINGKPLYYYKNQNDFTVPTNAGQITMLNCSNFTIKNTYMNNNDFSMIIAYCHDAVIENNSITDTNGETLLYASENITIQNNIFYDTFKAICLEYKSKNNIIRYNDISNNYVGISLFNNASNNTIYQNKVYGNHCQMAAGIEIVSYHGGTQRDNIIKENQIFDNLIGIHFRENTINNTIYNNNITKNKIGIFLQLSSDDNNISKNNFIKNIFQALFKDCSKNNWNNNYWNRPRFLPKIIFGIRLIGIIPVPCLDFDKNPAKTFFL